MTYTAEGFRAMDPSERPFGESAMSIGEIETHYRDAAHPRGEYKLLAELCDTTPGNIKKLLEARGKILSPQARIELIEKMLEEKKPVGEILEATKLSKNAFYSFCKSRSIELPGARVGIDERIEIIKRMRAEGAAPDEIMVELGVSPTTYWTFCKRYGLSAKRKKKAETKAEAAHEPLPVELEEPEIPVAPTEPEEPEIPMELTEPEEPEITAEPEIPVETVAPTMPDETVETADRAQDAAVRAISRIVYRRLPSADALQQIIGVLAMLKELEEE